jgi:hypothetical protein
MALYRERPHRSRLDGLRFATELSSILANSDLTRPRVRRPFT